MYVLECVPNQGLLIVIPLEKVTLVLPLGPRTHEELPAVVLVHLVDLPQQADVAVSALRVVEICPGKMVARLDFRHSTGPKQPEFVWSLLADSLLGTGSLVSFTQLCWRLIFYHINVIIDREYILGSTDWITFLFRHQGVLYCVTIFITFDFGLVNIPERGEFKLTNRLGNLHRDLWLLL